MKLKRMTAFALAVVLVCTVFASCSKEVPVADITTTTQAVAEKTTIKASTTAKPEEKTEIDLTDSDGNVITFAPVYNIDGMTLIAGYIESVKDKDGKALDQKAYPYIKQVIALETDNQKKTVIKYGDDKKFITLAALADGNGYIIALQDSIDVDGDKDTKEYFKAITTIDDSKHITIKLAKDPKGNLINVTVKTSQDGNKTVTNDKGKPIKVTESDKSNNLKDIGKDKEKDPAGKKPSQGTDKKDPTKPTAATEPEVGNSIVLKKNGKGSTNSPNVAFSMESNQGVCKINAGGEYVITSETDVWHGQIIIELPNTDEADLRFEDVNISSTTANVIKILDKNISTERTFFEEEAAIGTAADDTLSDTMKLLSKQDSAPDVALTFPTGTSSSFSTSAKSYSGVIYNESKLTIKGNGSVDIKTTKNNNNAICSTKSITFKNVSAYLETPNYTSTSSLSSARGIFSYAKVTVNSGSLKIRSNGDCIRCDDLYVNGGTVDLYSGSSDGVDSDDRIMISDGNVKSIALEKSSFKVRRVNNQENINDGDTTIKLDNGITKPDQSFIIDGGTVRGEGKSCSKATYIPNKNVAPTAMNLSKQVSILCTSAKTSGDDGVKSRVPIIFKISGAGINVSSENKCGRFIYSSPALSKANTYQISSDGRTTVNLDKSGYVGNSATVKVKAVK